VRQLALVKMDESIGQFVDPQDPTQAFPNVRMKFAEPVMQVGFRWENYVDAMNFLTPERQRAPRSGPIYGTAWLSASLPSSARVASCAVVAYGFARINFPGRDLLFILVMGTIMLPFQAIMIPQYILFNDVLQVGQHLPAADRPHLFLPTPTTSFCCASSIDHPGRVVRCSPD